MLSTNSLAITVISWLELNCFLDFFISKLNNRDDFIPSFLNCERSFDCMVKASLLDELSYLPWLNVFRSTGHNNRSKDRKVKKETFPGVWVLYLSPISEKGFYFIACIVAVRNRHVQVHKNALKQRIRSNPVVVERFHSWYRLVPIYCLGYLKA